MANASFKNGRFLVRQKEIVYALHASQKDLGKNDLNVLSHLK